MGACDFRTVANGKTAAEAFRNAVTDAAWEYGHGGYTGTIAEKHNYIVVDVPDGRDAKEWVTTLSAARSGQAAADGMLSYGVYKDEAMNAHVEAIKRADAEALATVESILGRQQAKKVLAALHDKWGPCLAVRSGEDEWTFFGSASS
jgi:hypothetical protein